MKRTVCRLLSGVLIFCFLAVPVFAAQELVPVGEVIGLEVNAGTLTVAAFDDTVTAARDAGIQIGDEILSIDENPVSCAQDVRRALDRSDGTVEVTLLRDGRKTSLRVSPAVSAEGPKLGIFLRQGILGIGTVTFYDPATHRFGTLGHGVSDSKGRLLAMTGGRAFDAKIVGIQKGKPGAPGQLKGAMEDTAPIGTLTGNSPQGVFGTAEGLDGPLPLPVAPSAQVHTGPARIRCAVTETGPREYSVEIVKIYPETKSDGRNLLIHVTDPELLSLTGGIVQGMSGSPIIQDGKLVGAVTHVLVNDPTRGYGIFIENMLDAAG